MIIAGQLIVICILDAPREQPIRTINGNTTEVPRCRSDGSQH